MSERPITPDTFDTVRALLEEQSEEMHSAMPGRVHGAPRYADNGDLVVDVELQIRHAYPLPDGGFGYDEYPILASVPVMTFGGAEWFVSIPVKEGDYMLVVFCDSAIGHWRVGDGSIQYPGDLRRHHISHAVAIPGLRPRVKAIPKDQGAGLRDTDLVFGKVGGTRVAVREDGEARVMTSSGVAVRVEANGNTHVGTDTGNPLAMGPAADDRIETLRNAILLIASEAGVSPPPSCALPLASVGATKAFGT